MKKNRKGFTLTELLAIIVIISILITLAVPAILKYIKLSKDKMNISNAVNTANSVLAYYTSSRMKEGMTYDLNSINSKNLLGKELHKSPYGYPYDDSSYVYVDSSNQIYICLLDTFGNAIGLIDDKGELNSISLKEIDKTYKILKLDKTKRCKAYSENGGGLSGGNDGENIKLSKLILGNNNSNVLPNIPTLNNEYSIAGDPVGLYVSTDTNDGKSTYYFRGNVENNYVEFGGNIWRIVRINEDGTIRLLLTDSIASFLYYPFNINYDNIDYMYFSNSDVEQGIKRAVDTWYNDELKASEKYIADTNFCEKYKVSPSTTYYTAGNETVISYENYIANFKCSTDSNGKGILKSKIGLLSYDEAIHAGTYPNKKSDSYIKTKGNRVYWLISPAGFEEDYNSTAWYLGDENKLTNVQVSMIGSTVRPVISIYDRPATGSGTYDDPYVLNID